MVLKMVDVLCETCGRLFATFGLYWEVWKNFVGAFVCAIIGIVCFFFFVFVTCYENNDTKYNTI